MACVQNRYSIDDRANDGVLRACAGRGIAFVPFRSVAGTGSPAHLAENVAAGALRLTSQDLAALSVPWPAEGQ